MISAYDIMVQIKTYTKIFKFVGLTGQLARILDQQPTYKTQMPAVYVCFKDETVESSDILNGAAAQCNSVFACYVVLDNSVDSTGAQASQIDRIQCQQDLLSCLYNWVPTTFPVTKPIDYIGSELVDLTGSRAVYAISFEVTYQISGEENGFIPNYQNLQEIDVDSNSINMTIT